MSYIVLINQTDVEAYGPFDTDLEAFLFQDLIGTGTIVKLFDPGDADLIQAHA